MKKKPVTQDFEMTLGEFATIMKAKVALAKRDAAEFAKQGTTAEQLTAVETSITEFENLPTDDELLGLQMNATAAKDKASEVLKSSMLEILGRAASKYGIESGYYRQFGVKALSALDGGELTTAARRVFRVGTKMLEDLADEGLTAAMLTALKTNTDAYETNLIAQEEAIANREIAVETRLEKANAIYAVVVKLCDKGKRIWQATNQAKYNDYVLYQGSPAKQDETKAAKAAGNKV